MSRTHAFSGSPYETRFGISRGVRAGRIVAVTGTAPLDKDGRTVSPGDPAAQARRCLEIVRDALRELGGDLRDVVRTRVLLTRIDDYDAVMLVHGDVFRGVHPASTVMQVVRFIDPVWLVEIEADAVIEAT
jgi:enamine deaminase RidA (YjgF/YER057c/UK114 family)